MAGGTVVMLLGHLTPKRLKFLGAAATAAGVLGLVALVGLDLSSWLGMAPPSLHQYAVQRALFAIGTNTDLPLVQVAVAGAVCWIVGIRRTTRTGDTPSPVELGEHGPDDQFDGPAPG